MAIAGVGVDLVDVERVERMLASLGKRMLDRLFTSAEVEYSMARSIPARHLAARLAAKEAGFKALAGSAEARSIGWKELEVVSADGAGPALAVHGRARERAELLGISRIHLSLTHSNSAAAAVVILEVESGPISETG